jgi:hypothetical protein
MSIAIENLPFMCRRNRAYWLRSKGNHEVVNVHNVRCEVCLTNIPHYIGIMPPVCKECVGNPLRVGVTNSMSPTPLEILRYHGLSK